MRMLGWLFGGALTLGLSCPIHAQISNSAPEPSGKMIDVGGYRVHIYCVGSGSPTVVITGAGYSFDWSLVQPNVAKFTRVCTYDHSGVAWSDSGPPDTCALRVAEIHSAMRHAGIESPYVLVGHSLGALVARLYASEYPEEVVGIVMIDHAMEPVLPDKLPAGDLSRAMSPLAARNPNPNAGFEKLPEHDYQLHVWANSQSRFSTVMARNVEMIGECEAKVGVLTNGQARPLGDRPVVVVSQAATEPLHRRLLALSSNSKQEMASGSGHYIMVDRPDLVIRAIREVFVATQNHSRLNE